MKLSIVFLMLICVLDLSAKDKLGKHLHKQQLDGLDRIIKERYYRVLTTRNIFDYFIYQGESKGLQYEKVKHFTNFLNSKYIKGKKELKIVFELVPTDYDQLIPMLLEGKGDIIAADLTVTPAREKEVAFSKPFQKVDEVIVTRKELESHEWKGKNFYVRKSSSYYETLQNFKDQVKVNIVDENIHTENIMELVSLGKFDYTVVDSNLAYYGERSFSGLVSLKDKPFQKNQKIAWAVRKENKKLLAEINEFLPKIKKGSLLGNMFSKKYFSNMGKIQSKDFNLKTSTLSKYDDLIKKYSKKYGIDWRLAASLCYQESRFNQNIVNRWGAIGLFQIKQMTASEPYINIPEVTGKDNAENNVHAGIKYLTWIKKRYFDSNPQMDQQARFRMAIAAYNAGPARVLQAIKKAKELGLNSNKWFRGVELAMLKMGYPEPVNYVSEINKRYLSYQLLDIKL